MLAGLLGLTGAEYCCVADAALGKVVEEAGTRSTDEEGAALAVLGWGSSAATLLSGGGTDALDDLIVTTRRSYHLVRVLDPASGSPLLIYLRVDRRRGNLAVVRRGLVAARPATTVPTQRTDPQVTTVGACRHHGRGAHRRGDARSPATPPARAGGVVALPRRRPVALPAPRNPAPPSPVARSPDSRVAGGLEPEGGRWYSDTATLERVLRALRRSR